MEKKSQEGAPEGAEKGKRRRRYLAGEKLRLVTEREAPGSSVSLVARKYGISPSQLFRWRHLKEAGGESSLRRVKATCLRNGLLGTAGSQPADVPADAGGCLWMPGV